MKKTRTRENDAVFFMLLGLTAVFFCWRCRYGFAEADEAFYPTIAYRLTQGDRLLVDEWHMSQLSSVLLYLPVLLFTRLTGGTAGIYLALRYLYVAVQCLVAATVYLRLRRYHSLGAAAGALALAVYAPYGINALSYNSLGILLMAMTGALLVPAEEESRAAYILAGLSFAGSVLCCPYLIAVYLLYALFVFIPRKKKKLPAFYPRPFGLFTLGAAGLAIVFFFVGLAGADLSRLDEILKGIFSDPAHPERTSLLKSVCQAVMDYPRLVFYHGHWRPGACMVLVLLMIPAALLDKHRERHAPAYFLIGTILTIAAEVLYVSAWNVPNFMMYAANVLALLCFFIAHRERAETLRRFAFLFWLPCMIYSGLIIMASNQRQYAVFSAAACAVPGSLTVIAVTARGIFKKEKAWLRRFSTATLAALALLQIGGTAFLRYEYVIYQKGNEDRIALQTEHITEGPQKGIIANPTAAEEYATTVRVMKKLEALSRGGEVLPLTRNTWMFMGNYRNAAFSAWLTGVDSVTLDRLEMYYSLNPGKRPDAVWVGEKNAEYAEEFCSRFGYTGETTPDGIFLTPDE